jgi:exopolyphosphatase/guanosine-5'-triphosphate,3'-diphosphate pyrophosphatase
MRRHQWQRAVGSSATIQQLLAAAYLLTHKRMRAKQPLAIRRHSLEEMIKWLSDSTSEERIQMPGLDPRRQDLALPTAVALHGWMEACGVNVLHYAPGSLREGLVIDYLIKHHERRQRIEHPLSEWLGSNGRPELSVAEKAAASAHGNHRTAPSRRRPAATRHRITRRKSRTRK